MKTSYFLLLGAVLLLGACGNRNGEYDASGIFETTEVIVSAKENGEIIQLNLEEGETVTPETSLGCIDTTQLYLQKMQLTAGRKSTDSKRLDEDRQLATLRQQIAIQQRERRRYRRLVQADAANQKQLDDINYQIQVLERQLSAAKEQLSSTNSSLSNQSSGYDAQLAQLNDRIKNCLITSPIRGTILTKYAEQGEYAIPGKALFKVADVEDMKLRAYITAGQLTGIKIGQQVSVFADRGDSDRKEYQGIVSWISDKAEFTPKTIQTRDERANLVYAIKISVKNDGYIKQGMYGEIKL